MMFNKCVDGSDGEWSPCMEDDNYHWKPEEDYKCWAYTGGAKDGECVMLPCGPPCETKGEQMEQKIADGLAKAGFDEGAFNTWLENLGTSWEELLK